MIVIRSGRHPFEVVLLAVFLLSGVSNLANYNASASNALRGLSDTYGYVYYAGLALGSAITLVGVFWPGLSGPLVERAGLLILTGLWASFGGLLLAFGWRGVQFALLFFGFAAGAVWRIVQIRRDLRQAVSAAVVTGATDQVEDG